MWRFESWLRYAVPSGACGPRDRAIPWYQWRGWRTPKRAPGLVWCTGGTARSVAHALVESETHAAIDAGFDGEVVDRASVGVGEVEVRPRTEVDLRPVRIVGGNPQIANHDHSAGERRSGRSRRGRSRRG